MPNIQFGTGNAAFVPSNINSPLLTTVNPLYPSLLQEIGVDFKASNKELYGRQQWAADVARGKISASGKGKIIATDINFLNQLYFGLPSSAGAVRPLTETHTIASSTVTVVKGANFAVDYGVVSAATGIPLQYVPSSPIEGQYTVNTTTGVYTFFASETITQVIITYAWTDTTSGTTTVISNQTQGYSPQFSLNMWNTYQGKTFVLNLTTCKLTDIGIPFKMEDYSIADMSFMICANAAGIVGTIYADQ